MTPGAAKAPGEKANPMRAANHRFGNRIEQTPRERAQELAALELAAPGSVLNDARDGSWRTAVQVAGACRRRMAAFLPGDVETALDYLASRGLAEQRMDDGLCSPARPQGYRWAKGIGADRLRAFTAPEDRRKRRGACPYCGRMPQDGLKFCNRDCALAHGRAQRAAGAEV